MLWHSICILFSIARKKTVLLDNEALRLRLDQGEIKQWWLARRLAVDRKTITRWVSGKTQRISAENLTRLAAEIGCTEEDISVQDSLEALGTREDRWQAARQLQDKDLVGMVGPTYSWELAESLIRSTIDSQMPLDLQAGLYLKLAACGLYQHKHELVKSSAEIAFSRAIDAGDDYLQLRAREMLAVHYLMIGQMPEAIRRYDEIRERQDLFKSEVRLASLLCNQGLAYWSIAEFDDALRVFDEAMPIWDRNDPVISTATGWWLRAKLLIELSMVRDCIAAVERCEEISRGLNYAKCANMCVAIRAELASLDDNHEEALAMAEKANEVFKVTPTVNPASLESIARVWRRAGMNAEALAEINRLIDSEHEDRLHYGRYRQEKARILLAMDRTEEAWREIELANGIFRELEAPKRILNELPQEYYIQYRPAK